MITVLFDGKCGLCRREISFYRKIAPTGRFRWIDVMRDDEAMTALAIDRQAALKAIHVFDDNGLCLTGADAFVTIWRALPGFRLLGQVVGSRPLLPLARWIYAAFGALRYRFRGYDRCDV